MFDYEDDKIAMDVNIDVKAYIKVHNAHNGGEDFIDIDDFFEAEDKHGGTVLRYYTGDDDLPIDGFRVMETADEVYSLHFEAVKKRDAFRNGFRLARTTDEPTNMDTIERIEAWLSEHLEKDTCVVSSGVTHVSFDTLMVNFRKEFGIKEQNENV